MDIYISIIIPVYHVECYIGECLDSILSQSLRNLEVICIDDGSEDGTVDIIAKYERNDSRIKLINQPHRGVSSARNLAIGMTKGKYMMFVDGDDLLYDERTLETLYLEAEQHNALICGGNVILFEKDWGTGRRYSSTRNPDFLKDGEVFFEDYGCPYGFTQYIYKRELIVNNSIFFPKYACWEDPVFMAEVFSKAKRFWGLNRYVYCYRRGTHKKEHRMSDFIELLYASADLMRIGADNNNIMLQKDTLFVLYFHRLRLLQIYEYDCRFVRNKLEEISKLVLSEVAKDSCKEVTVLEEAYYIQKKKELEQEIYRLISECKNKSIIIYGAGDYGKRMYEFLKKYNVPVLGFAVSETKNETNKYLFDKPIKEAEKWIEQLNLPFKHFVISVYDKKQRGLIKEYLRMNETAYIEYDIDILEEKLIV